MRPNSQHSVPCSPAVDFDRRTNNNQSHHANMLENRQDVVLICSWGFRKVLKILILVVLLLILYGASFRIDSIVENSFSLPEIDETVTENHEIVTVTQIKIAVVACQGSRKDTIIETLTMMKSVIIFAKANTRIHFFIFTDDESGFNRFLRAWPETFKTRFTLSFHEVNYPLSESELIAYKNWWAPCASFRLFLPEVLTEEDAVIYVDTDTIFLSDVRDLWELFDNFDEKQVAGLAPRKQSGYNVPVSNPNFIDIPGSHTKTQVNSGIFLMNLTRMRMPVFNTDYTISAENLTWNKTLLFPLFEKFKKDMAGDQNLINVVFHYNPKLVYFMDCKFNYHHKFCIDRNPSSWCRNAETEGARIIHGSARAFYNNYAPAFKAVFNAFQVGANYNDTGELLKVVRSNLLEDDVDKHPHCGNKVHVFTNSMVNL